MGLAGVYISVASASPIHVFPVQRVLKNCVCTNIVYYNIYNKRMCFTAIIGPSVASPWAV